MAQKSDEVRKLSQSKTIIEQNNQRANEYRRSKELYAFAPDFVNAPPKLKMVF